MAAAKIPTDLEGNPIDVRKIDRFWVYVSEDEDGEGIIGVKTDDGWMPFIASDKDRIDNLKPFAINIAKATKRPVKLVEYSVRKEIETWLP